MWYAAIGASRSGRHPTVGIWLEEHRRHLTLRREHRRITLRMRFGKMRTDFSLPVLSVAVAHGFARARLRQNSRDIFA